MQRSLKADEKKKITVNYILTERKPDAILNIWIISLKSAGAALTNIEARKKAKVIIWQLLEHVEIGNLCLGKNYPQDLVLRILTFRKFINLFSTPFFSPWNGIVANHLPSVIEMQVNLLKIQRKQCEWKNYGHFLLTVVVGLKNSKSNSCLVKRI